MEVTETLSQGLKREFKVVLPATDLATRLEGQLVRGAGQGAHQRLSSRQGAGRASEAALWPLDHG